MRIFRFFSPFLSFLVQLVYTGRLICFSVPKEGSSKGTKNFRLVTTLDSHAVLGSTVNMLIHTSTTTNHTRCTGSTGVQRTGNIIGYFCDTTAVSHMYAILCMVYYYFTLSI